MRKKEEKLKQAKVLSKIFEKEMSKSAIDQKTEKIEKRLKQQVREKLERDRIEALKRIYEYVSSSEEESDLEPPPPPKLTRSKRESSPKRRPRSIPVPPPFSDEDEPPMKNRYHF